MVSPEKVGSLLFHTCQYLINIEQINNKAVLSQFYLLGINLIVSSNVQTEEDRTYGNQDSAFLHQHTPFESLLNVRNYADCWS